MLRPQFLNKRMTINAAFTDPTAVSKYVQGTPQRVPGFADLHRMALVLLSERAPTNANILVLGAGGGLELRAFTDARPHWSFVGVAPSRDMLDLGRSVVGTFDKRVAWIEGYIDDTPNVHFDGATCLLTLHFLSVEERRKTLKAIRARLQPGAPLIIAHHTSQGVSAERTLARSIAFAATGPIDWTQVASSASNMAKHLMLLTRAEEEELLREAGFGEPLLFYTGFSFQGWVAFAQKA